jgi:hypothetical protein
VWAKINFTIFFTWWREFKVNIASCFSMLLLYCFLFSYDVSSNVIHWFFVHVFCSSKCSGLFVVWVLLSCCGGGGCLTCGSHHASTARSTSRYAMQRQVSCAECSSFCWVLTEGCLSRTGRDSKYDLDVAVVLLLFHLFFVDLKGNHNIVDRSKAVCCFWNWRLLQIF